MKTHIFPIYGQGGKSVDAVLSGDGLGYMQQVLDAIPGVEAHDPIVVQPAPQYGAFSWDAGAEIARQVRKLPLMDKLVIGPCVSLGANEGPLICESLLGFRDVDLLIGIQPSMFGRKNLVPSNVIKAVCIYNPIYFMTWGLGAYLWELKPNNTRTRLIPVTSWWPHPGDNNKSVRDRVTSEVEAVRITE
jgi:hypothetical protein